MARSRNVLAALTTLTVGGTAALLGSAGGASAAATDFPAHYAAPYLQISDQDAGDLTDDQQASGVNDYTLAFLTSSSGCTLQWEDGGDPVGAFKDQIGALTSAGGQAIPSFGGAGSTELAQSCTDTGDLTNAYKNVVDTYGTKRLDFDIEGDTLNDTAATTRRDQALAALQQQDSSVQVDFTLPVAPDGLPSQELDLLKDAKDNGVNVSVVNIMTMDFGDGENALDDALSAAKATAGQLADLYGISTSDAYGKLGLTPIAGQNDDDENFSQDDANQLESFAASNGVQELSFWEVDQYDKPAGYAYSKIFHGIGS